MHRVWPDTVLFTIQVILCGLLLANIKITGRNSHHKPSIEQVTMTRFGSVKQYMSLDHQYDDLWFVDADAEAGREGTVRTNLDNLLEKPQWGNIAMYDPSSLTSLQLTY